MSLSSGFFPVSRCAFGMRSLAGLGGIATVGGLNICAAESGGADVISVSPLLEKQRHFTASARRVIFLFMLGGPSQHDTLVVWGGEFGRTPVGQKTANAGIGRDHQISAFTMWMAGAGVRHGQTIGETDELGCLPLTRPIPVHDIHATILHLLGLDHRRLTFHFQGRDFRLTDVAGNVVQELI